MEFFGSHRFRIRKELLWKLLNDPEVIKYCINGCKEFKEKKENEFEAIINVKLGPVNANFKGIIKIKDIIFNKGYTIDASGNAGQLGFAKGIVKVNLENKQDYTIIEYKAKTVISGKIAQLGSRLIEGSVKKNTDKFFSNLQNSIDSEKKSINKMLEKKNTLYKHKTENVLLFLSIIVFIFSTIFYIFY